MHTQGAMAESPKPERGEGALFDFDDLQALRDEYEERIARLERERDAAVAGLGAQKPEPDPQSGAQLQELQELQERLKNETAARQELIHELTFELAAAREQGERRAQDAERHSATLQQQLAAVLTDVGRLETDLQKLKETLRAALPPATTAAPPPATAPAQFPATTASAPAATPVAETPVAATPVAATPVAATPVAAPPVAATPVAAPPPPDSMQELSASVRAYAPVRKKKIRLR